MVKDDMQHKSRSQSRGIHVFLNLVQISEFYSLYKNTHRKKVVSGVPFRVLQPGTNMVPFRVLWSTLSEGTLEYPMYGTSEYP